MYLCTCHGFGRILPPRNPSICSVLDLKIVLGLGTSQGIRTFFYNSDYPQPPALFFFFNGNGC